MESPIFDNPCLGRIVFSQRPIGPLHIGQLVGSLLPVTNFQEHYETLFIIADGAPGSAVDQQKKKNIHELLAGWLAAGLSPNESVIVQLSQLMELDQMVKILQPLVEDEPVSPLPGASETLPESALLLLFAATHTPAYPSSRSAGDLASILVQRINARYNLNLPTISWLPLPTSQLPGVDGQPMFTARNNAIWLKDSEEETQAKINRLPKNVLQRYVEHFIHEPAEQTRVLTSFDRGDLSEEELHKLLGEGINEGLHSLRVKRAKWLAAPGELDAVLAAGLRRGRTIARQNIQELRLAMESIPANRTSFS